MKILWFANTPCSALEKLNPNLHLGGWLKSLEKQLVQDEDVNLSVCFYWNAEMEPFYYKKTMYYPILRQNGKNKVTRLLNRVMNKNNNAWEIKALQEVIDKVNPDIIHVHGTEDNFGLIQKYTRIPTVISIQGIIAPCCEKYYSGISASDAYWNEGVKPKLLHSSIAQGYKSFKNRVERETIILSDAKNIIGRTDWDRRISELYSKKRNYFEGNEILRDIFYETQWKKTKFEESLQLITIMSDPIYKGFETIVKTTLILKQLKVVDFTWNVIGVDEHSSIIKIVKKYLEIDYNGLNIRFFGKKNEQEIVDLLLKSDIYCQVSHIENSPNSLCEAMLIGMPIIATYAGGTSSLLTDKKEGILVQEGEPYGYAGAIYEMTNNFNVATEMAQEARKRAIKRHDKKIITERLFKTYDDVLKLKES